MRRPLRFVLLSLAVLAIVAGLGFLVVLRTPSIQDAIVERIARTNLSQNHAELFQDDALRALVCGSSSPMPDPRRAKACIAVIAGGKMYIVDTGPDSYGRLALWRMPVDRITAVLFTHFHSDHIGDLGEFNMNSWGLGRPAALDVYGPPGVEHVVAGFAEAYGPDEGYRIAHHGAELMSPDRWKMVPHPIALPGEATPARDRTAVVYDDGTLKITAIEVNHTPVEPAYGYRFDYKGRSLVISGDTRKHEPLARAAAGADVLFHEAQAQHLVKTINKVATELGNARLAKITSDIQTYHTSPVEAAALANEAKVKLLVLYHFTPPILNKVAEAAFTRGLPEARQGDWLVSHDGTLIELPVGSTEVRQLSID